MDEIPGRLAIAVAGDHQMPDIRARAADRVIAGGLLTGKYNQGQEGRLTHDKMYKSRYGQSWMHTAASALGELANELGVSAITLAIAWVAHNPAVTAPILSASRSDQLKPSLDAIGFKLDDATYARLTALTPTPAPATDRSEDV